MIEISQKPEDNLIYANRTGEIYLEDVIEYIESIEQEYKELNHLYVLDDTRGSVSKYNHLDDYHLLIEVMAKCISNFHGVHVAIVVDTPVNAALIDIYKVMTNKISNYFFKIFSTTEAAKIWLKMFV